MNRTTVGTLAAPIAGIKSVKGLRLAVRGFIALAALLTITITATSATMLYNAATALRDEAEAAAVNLVEILSASFASVGEISLANVARTLDATLDDQMTAQARLAAHLVAAAEAAGQDPARVIETLEAVVATTVLDEFWITDETAFSYLTNVRDQGSGELVPFTFDPDPTVQPQASKFYVLLAAPLDGDDVITQPAQVREIDQQVFKYVGVGGVDKHRIVQVGNALAFGEQEILSNTYTSMRADVSAVIEGILDQHMTVEATLADYFVAAAEEAAWPADEINGRLRRIVSTTAIGEIRVGDASGAEVYSSVPPPLAGGSTPAFPYMDALSSLFDGSERVVQHPTAPRDSDGAVYKYVTIASAGSPRIVQVGIPIESSAGNLLYTVYQNEADRLVRQRNLEALWVVNPDGALAAAAPRAAQAGAGVQDAARTYGRRAEALVDRAVGEGRVVSTASLSPLSPADRGVWVASPIINPGGIPIGGVALAMSLDDIALTVQREARNTTLIAFALLAFTAAAALWGTRWLTRPIEVIAAAARQVESGKQPDDPRMEAVLERTDEIGSLARVFDAMTIQVFNREEQLELMVSQRTEELQASNRSLQLAQQALQEDLEMAKVVQAALVREGNAELGGFSAYSRMTPAQQVGGDFVDMLEPSSGKLFLTVCDVSGKGVAAALFMAASQGAINSAASAIGDVADIATQANRRLCAENPTGLFVTGMLAIVDLERGYMDYVCAGHEPAFLVRGDDSLRVLPMTGGLAMGVFDDFDYASRREELQVGETLFLYTDGLTDAVNHDGELFGKERLEATLDGTPQRSPEEIVDHVWHEILGFSAGAPAADDKTCLVLRRHR